MDSFLYGSVLLVHEIYDSYMSLIQFILRNFYQTTKEDILYTIQSIRLFNPLISLLL